MLVVEVEVKCLADKGHLERAVQEGLAKTCVEQRRLVARIGANLAKVSLDR